MTWPVVGTIVELYGASEAAQWTWARVLNDPEAYADWVEEHYDTFTGKFGNHRKYESLKPSPKGTGAVVHSYVDWITGFGSHAAMVAQAQAQANGNARRAFNVLYEMRAVMRFGCSQHRRGLHIYERGNQAEARRPATV